MKIPRLSWILRGSLVALLVVLFIRQCARKETPAAPPAPLAPHEALRVNVKDSRVTVTTKSDTETRYVPHSGGATISLKDDGNVDIDVRTAGFTLEPGFGVLLTNRLRVAVDVEFAYWNRASLIAGIGLGPMIEPAMYAGIGYSLGQLHMDNTSVFVAYTSRKEFGAGIRVRL